MQLARARGCDLAVASAASARTVRFGGPSRLLLAGAHGTVLHCTYLETGSWLRRGEIAEADDVVADDAEHGDSGSLSVAVARGRAQYASRLRHWLLIWMSVLR